MARWQNLEYAFFEEVEGKYNFPTIEPVYEVPDIDKFIKYSACKNYRSDRHDRKQVGVHFFEHDYKFESAWTFPNRAGEMLSSFAYILGPDFSQYIDFPKAIQIYNRYRNNWLCRYWQLRYNITVIPVIGWGMKDSYDWCFDGYPKNSIVAVSNVGLAKHKDTIEMFNNGYNEMLNKLNPTKILFFTRSTMTFPGNVQYIHWER